MRARGWLLIALATAAVLLLLGRTVTALVVDHAWYAAMGVPSLFWEQITDRLLLQGGAWVAGALFAWGNLHAVRRTILAVAVPSRVANIELTAMVPGQRLSTLTLGAAVLVGALLAVPLSNWSDVAMARHGLPFGEIEGILDRDLGFYVYWLPLEETLYLWALVSVVTITALVLVLYALTRSLRLEGRRLAASNHVRRHLSALGALVLLLLAWSYRLDAFDLLQQGSGPDGLFLRLDHRVTLRVDFILSLSCALAAAVILRAGWVGQLRTAFVTLTLVLVGAVGLRHVAPAVLARGDLLGDPARRDQDYVASRTLFSRRAYDVDAMRMATDGAVTASTDSIVRRAALPAPLADIRTLSAHASLWDHRTLAIGLGERPETSGSKADDRVASGRSPTAAASVDSDRGTPMVEAAPVGWTVLEGRLSALLVRRPVASGERWRVFVADATRPVLRDSAVDPSDGLDDEALGSWPLVGPGIDGARRIETTDSSDVPAASLEGRRARLSHAWALRDASLLESDETEVSAPKLVTHRDVRDRVQRLAPVFVQGADVVPVRHADRLYWAVQLYSASDYYPLSQRWVINDRWVGYFKLAATALIDASTGRVRLVPSTRPDPVTRTWMTRFPTLFTPGASLAPGLAAQLPTATESAMVQLRTFARYGSRLDGSTRHLPDSVLTGGAPAPYLVGADGQQLMAWSVPLLDSIDQLDGVLVATGGGERATWWHPVTAPRLRWRTLTDQLQAVGDSARASAASTRRDARVRTNVVEAIMTTRGPLLLQTVRGMRSDGTAAIVQVGVTDGRQVAVAGTLAEALIGIGERPAGLSAGTPGTPRPGPRDGDAGRLYDAMRRALQRGDWTAFGAAFDSLGQALRRPPL